jgi:hypothetical protein
MQLQNDEPAPNFQMSDVVQFEARDGGPTNGSQTFQHGRIGFRPAKVVLPNLGPRVEERNRASEAGSTADNSFHFPALQRGQARARFAGTVSPPSATGRT